MRSPDLISVALEWGFPSCSLPLSSTDVLCRAAVFERVVQVSSKCAKTGCFCKERKKRGSFTYFEYETYARHRDLVVYLWWIWVYCCWLFRTWCAMVIKACCLLRRWFTFEHSVLSHWLALKDGIISLFLCVCVCILYIYIYIYIIYTHTQK